MTTRKRVKAVKAAALKPQQGFSVAFEFCGDPEWVPGIFEETPADCKEAITRRSGIRWSVLKKSGHYVIPVTISPRVK